MSVFDYKLINGTNIKEWKQALSHFKGTDIYHLPEYHLLAQAQNEGKAFLFIYQKNGDYAALPFLVKQVSHVGGLRDCQLCDATSVYGYPGVLTTLQEKSVESDYFKIGFQNALVDTIDRLNIVTFFSRTNPLFVTSWLLDGIADIITAGRTVVIDLTKPAAQQLKDISKGHKYDIRNAKKNGVYVIEDNDFQNMDQFMSIYNESMMRVNASNHYFLSEDYYTGLRKFLGNHMRVYFAKIGQEFVSGAIFLCNNGIIQYHLSGVSSKYVRLSGSKMIINEVREWGSKNGFKYLFLGGGLRSTDDSLFRFKAGFSNIRLPFQMVKMIRNHYVYEELSQRHNKWLKDNSFESIDKEYFPCYRGPYKKN
jgi:hypothetical protein